MKKIDCSKLKVGDIILSTSPGWEGDLVRWGTKSDISHAMLYVAPSSVMDSTGDGVHARNIDKMFFEDDCALYAYRTKEATPSDKLQTIIEFVRLRTGARYSYIEAATSLLRLPLKGSSLQFCSRLVATAYESAGVQVVSGSHFFCTPENLKSSDFLTLIDGAVEVVSQDEIEHLRAEGDSTIGMREATNRLLELARKVWPLLSTLNDVESFVIKNPAKDMKIADAYKRSGYLQYYKVELQRFPWRYDEMKMMKFFSSIAPEGKEAIIRYCIHTHIEELNGVFDHWKSCLIQTHKIAAETKLETFKLLEELYFNLCHNHLRRVEVARKVIGIEPDLH